jgi:hypothetical protein
MSFPVRLPAVAKLACSATLGERTAEWAAHFGRMPCAMRVPKAIC